LTLCWGDGISHLAIVGGGLVGASAAYRALKRGANVTLIDCGACEGRATRAGAGILSPGSRFIGAGDVLPLVKQAVARYPSLIAQLRDDGEADTGYEEVGALHVATTEEDAARLPSLLNALEGRFAEGYSHIGAVDVLDAPTARAAFPALGPVKRALHIAGAARVDGRALLEALLGVIRRLGARVVDGRAEIILEGDQAVGVEVDGRTITADAIIIAAGAWSGLLTESLGVHVPVRPQRGQIAHLRLPDTDTSHWPIVLGFHSHYLLTFPENRLVAGATREDKVGFDHRVTAAGMHEVLSEALVLAPGLAGATLVEVRVGFRPASPDELPFIGPVPGVAGAYVATGHGGYGLQVGPYTGEIVADLALGETVSVDLRPFAVDRLDRPCSSRIDGAFTSPSSPTEIWTEKSSPVANGGSM